MANYQKTIDSFLQDPLNRALADHYDPSQDLLRSIARNPREDLDPAFIGHILSGRGGINYEIFGRRAKPQDIVYADFREAQLSSVVESLAIRLELNPERAGEIDDLLMRRRRTITTAILATARDQNRKAFRGNRPASLEAFRAVGEVAAIYGHGYGGKAENNYVQKRDNGADFWTHPVGVGLEARTAIQEIAPWLPFNVKAILELLFHKHDTYEDSLKADSSHWTTMPNFLSPALSSDLAQRMRLKNPWLVGHDLYEMTRTRGLNNAKMSYLGKYMPRILAPLSDYRFYRLPGAPPYSIWVRPIVKRFDNGNNVLDAPSERQYRYEASIEMTKQAAEVDPRLHALVSYESRLSLNDINEWLATRKIDALGIRDQVQERVQTAMPELEMPLVA